MRDPKEIKSKAELAAFIAELESDLKNHPDGWENITLENFLEAMGAWAQDANLGTNIPTSWDRPEAWSLAATLLLAASIYE
jgi:hypothetical protein